MDLIEFWISRNKADWSNKNELFFFLIWQTMFTVPNIFYQRNSSYLLLSPVEPLADWNQIRHWSNAKSLWLEAPSAFIRTIENNENKVIFPSISFSIQREKLHLIFVQLHIVQHNLFPWMFFSFPYCNTRSSGNARNHNKSTRLHIAYKLIGKFNWMFQENQI